ncbi:phage tail fiber protein [Pectobacterium actinidiae]|uniref:phage tail fiber protein n=1 Tax=Pectobacterium TaxID=122277 RepID=UPI000691A5C5|nr:prophage tail fiber N-terminal domain-containing protein [Pectobacterium brasiliense]
MSVLISGVLINPAGIPVSGAEITFTALTTSDSVLNGFSASTVTNDDGEYAVPLEHCVYSIAIQSDGYNSIYGSVSINEKSTPTTINELLKLATMEQTVTPAIIVYFREIQTDVAVKLATMQTLSNNATTAARDATTARNEAAQYAQSLSAAVTQAQQASAAATASANTATTAKNAAETAAGNAQATLAGAMKKSANGLDIDDVADFRNNLGLKSAATHDVQESSIDATVGRVLKIANNGEGPFGLGNRGIMLATTDVVVQLRTAVNGWYRCAINTIRAPSTGAWMFLVMKWDDNTRCVLAISAVTGQGVQFITIGASTDSGWTPLWGQNNLTFPLSISNGGSSKTTGSFANGPNYQAARSLADFLSEVDAYGNNSAGSVTINDDGGSWHSYMSIRHRSGQSDGVNYGWLLEDRSMTSVAYDFYIRKKVASGWMEPVSLWHSANLASPATLNTTQAFTAEKVFNSGLLDHRSNYGRITSPLPVALTTIAQYNNMRIGDVLFINGSISSAALTPNGAASGYWHIVCTAKSDATAGAGSFVAYQLGIAFNQYAGTLSGGSSITWRRALYAGYNAVADSGGFWKTASPVISIYSDGSFTATEEANGVNVERMSEGVYKITGCQGMHPDAAWNGIDGGISNPKCRNDKALLWNNYEVDEDGSVTVYTFHRVHPDAMPFAQNRLTLNKEPFDAEKGHTPEMEWPDQTSIDVPKGLFIQVRVNMPERIEPKSVVMHSNVYCGTVSIAGAIPQ